MDEHREPGQQLLLCPLMDDRLHVADVRSGRFSPAARLPDDGRHHVHDAGQPRGRPSQTIVSGRTSDGENKWRQWTVCGPSRRTSTSFTGTTGLIWPGSKCATTRTRSSALCATLCWKSATRSGRRGLSPCRCSTL